MSAPALLHTASLGSTSPGLPKAGWGDSSSQRCHLAGSALPSCVGDMELGGIPVS